MTPKPHAAPTGAQNQRSEPAQGRHSAAIELLEGAVEPIVADMGFELLLLEWLGSGKRRILRVYLDSPAGVTIADCTRMGRIIGNGLDAVEAAAEAGEGDPALASLLGRPYTLEVSSPGVDRPLSKRHHFADQVGAKIKLKTWEPVEADSDARSFHGRLVAVEAPPDEDEDSAADPRRGLVVLHDPDQDRTLRIPIPLIRRANLVWEG